MDIIEKITQTPLFKKLVEKKLYVGIGFISFLLSRRFLGGYLALRRQFLSQRQLNSLKKSFLERREKQIDLAKRLIEKVSSEKQDAIINLSTLELAQAIKDSRFTCEEVFITFAYRAATIGIENCIISDIDVENNLLIAQEKDLLLQATTDKSTLPVFFGLPITIKEHLRVKGLLSCCGYIQLAGRPVETTDSAFVQLLREEGAIPFASTNIPQGLFAIESNNNIYGRALNPLNKKLTVGGSSGGEGGAQAARLSAFGIGSDSLGSARIPAAFCGVFSFKGTGKRISLKGRYGMTGSDVGGFKDIQTSIGPISQYIDDLIEIEKAVLGKFNKIDDEVPALYWDQKMFEQTSLKNVKIGVIRNLQNCPNVSGVENVLNEVVDKLKEQGADIHEMKDLPIEQMSTQIFKLLATPGVQPIIFKMLRGENMIKIHKSYLKTKLLPPWLNDLRGYILNKLGEKREASFLETQKTNDFIGHLGESMKLEVIKQQLSRYIQENNIDIIISPVVPFTAIRHDDGGDLLQFLGLPGVANALDLPAGVVPIRRVSAEEANPSNYKDIYNDKYTDIIKRTIELSENMPLSIQVASRTWNDEKCLKIMKEISLIFNYQRKQIS